MKNLQTVKKLEELGRVQLSKSFFMREFLYSEISQIEGISNIPENPEDRSGKKLVPASIRVNPTATRQNQHSFGLPFAPGKCKRRRKKQSI